MTNPKAEQLHTVKRWLRIQDSMKVRFREDGREGIVSSPEKETVHKENLLAQ